MTLNGFYINLDRSPQRREHMEAQLSRLQIDWVKRFSAIDGTTVTPGPGCRLSAGELACFLSHTQIIESAPEDSFTIIFEDDIELSTDLPLVMHPAQVTQLAPYDVVMLDCQPFWSSQTVLAMWRSMERQLVEPRELHDFNAMRRIRGVEFHNASGIYCWGLQAYMVTPNGRAKLIPLLRETLERGPPGPIDILIKHACSDGRLSGVALIPFLATPLLESHTATTIVERSQALDKLALVSAVRRMFFAGPLTGIEAYAQALRQPGPDISPPIQMLTDLVGQAFAMEAKEGSFVIG